MAKSCIKQQAGLLTPLWNNVTDGQINGQVQLATSWQGNVNILTRCSLFWEFTNNLLAFYPTYLIEAILKCRTDLQYPHFHINGSTLPKDQHDFWRLLSCLQIIRSLSIVSHPYGTLNWVLFCFLSSHLSNHVFVE